MDLKSKSNLHIMNRIIMALDEENVLSFINIETSLPSGDPHFFGPLCIKTMFYREETFFLLEDSEARNDKVNFQKIYQEIPQFY